MQTLLLATLLSLLAAITFCYDSHESIESREEIFMNPYQANSFMNRYNYRQRLLNAYKKPFERQREICEDYSPCENFARFRGYNRAYQHFFGKPGQTTRNRY
ncbi:matrix Gla protein [Polypterus senegalus]|uniref:matrix Gla protein n=1 Tax=Polypterus senegalus TaxID=55291 RepID=UPI0019663AB0|nr:matrix Gla protein [Polypterus senegalus]